MKPEKPKKAKAPAKRTPARQAASESASPSVEPSKKAAPQKQPATASRPVAAKAVPEAAPPGKSTPRPKSVSSKVPIPSILLEGDAPPAPLRTGPGERYAIGGLEPAGFPSEAAELPESYGTERLLLVARDPHWLYAHWDMTANQLRRHNAASRDGHLIVRVFHDQPAGKPILEQHVHPESRNWFLHVGRGGTKYVAQIGYHDDVGKWITLATSAATLTPPDTLSEETAVRFETIPVEVPFKKLIELVKEAVSEHVPLAEAIQQLRIEGHVDLPLFELAIGAAIDNGPTPMAAREWTPEQERALAEVLSIDEVRRVWMGSLEITELLRRALHQELASQAAAAMARGEQPGGAEMFGVTSVSSPFGGVEKRKGFWFNVNAELIIYGATEPDASVTIGGRRIRLRSDGTFSFRFALPDGNYDLPVQATAADESDSRSAKLHFSRATHYRGEVTAHPQDRSLKAPKAEHVS